VNPAEILCRLNAQYEEKTLSCASVYDWYSILSEGRTEVSNLLNAHTQLTAVCAVNICHTEEVILGTGELQCDAASNSGKSVRSVEIVIHEHLLFKKVCAQSIPTTLTFDQGAKSVAGSAKYLHWF
jgi:hypothetical protein